MKKIDETGLSLCRLQAEAFKKSVVITKCSSSIFIRRFMLSFVAERMDSGIIGEILDDTKIINEIKKQYGESEYGKIKFAEEEMYWIGYIYRYFSYTHQKSSKQVYRIIKPDELRDLYFPYHSLDPAQAIERILEAKQKTSDDMISEGIEILRRIEKNKQK